MNQASKSELPLDPGHLANLKKSGLLKEFTQKAEISSVCPRDIPKILGPYLSQKVLSLLKFPYPHCDGFARYKCFPAIRHKGRLIKYWQPPGTGNHLYFPPAIENIFQDTSIPLYLTEGEKKALKAMQEGLFCIGLSGLWNWSDGAGDLIEDFNRIDFKSRTIFIVPDSDWLQPNIHGYKTNLRQAVNELAYRLIDRGAKVFIVELPQEEVTL